MAGGLGLHGGHQTPVGDGLVAAKDPTLPIYTTLGLAAGKTGEKQV